MWATVCVYWVTVAAAVSAAYVDFHRIPEQLEPAPTFEQNAPENQMSYWHDNGKATLQEKLGVKVNTGVAKNVILFLGDGMSIPTVTAARIYLGQQSKKAGEETFMSFEKFPYTGLSKTYCVDSQVADSACSSTAYMTGVKGNIQTVGVTSDVKLNDCQAMKNTSYHTPSIVSWALAAGKGAGLVTTTSITDASPAGGYAHAANRSWWNDADIPTSAACSGVDDIAKQLILGEPGKNIKVILGGGTVNFLPTNKKDVFGNVGLRRDNRDLTQEWIDDKKNRSLTGVYVNNRDKLLGIDIATTDYILGLFKPDSLDYHLDMDTALQPTLEEMTKVAIQMLQKESNGFYLFVEGGLIDHGHHANKAKKALDETVEFAKAIEAAVSMTSEEDTLIVITADHSHTMTISGYPTRGSNILTKLQGADDGLPYSTLSYANGPGHLDPDAAGHRHDLSQDFPRDGKDYRFPSIYKLHWETHGGDDVAVFARGPYAHLLTGNYEQTYIPHVMGYASRMGPAADIPLASASARLIDHSFLAVLTATLVWHYS